MDYIEFVTTNKSRIIKITSILMTILGLFIFFDELENTDRYSELIFGLILFVLGSIIGCIVTFNCQFYTISNRFTSLGIKRLTIILSILSVMFGPVFFDRGIDIIMYSLISYCSFWILAAGSTWVYN